MALYLNGEGKQFILNGIAYLLHINEPLELVEGIKTTTSDGCILTDSDGLYITLKEAE